MGLSAASYDVFRCLSRKSDITYELSRLSNEKVALSREMTAISREYQEALNHKVLKWSNNAGTSYMDLSYQNLMKPSAMNQYTPYLLTDQNNKIVIDKSYLNYAKMISENGAPGGDWDSIRTQVLSEFTGVAPEKIDNALDSQKNIFESENYLNELIELEKEAPTQKGNLQAFLQYTGFSGGATFANGSSDWAQAYATSSNINLGSGSGARSSLEALINTIKTEFGKYFSDSDKEKFENYCDAFFNANAGFVDGTDTETEKISLNSDSTPISGSSSGYTVNTKIMLDTIMACCPRDCSLNSNPYIWHDINSTEYQAWKTERENWLREHETATSNYENSINSYNALFDAGEEKAIKFYDAIFSSIAEKGWTLNENVNDSNYLNELLQGNVYTLTTVNRQSSYDEDYSEISWINDYDTNIASNCSNIFSVNDSDLVNQKLAALEHKKEQVKEKETRKDIRMKNLDTELSAITQFIQSLENTKKGNIERTMNLFS